MNTQQMTSLSRILTSSAPSTGLSSCPIDSKSMRFCWIAQTRRHPQKQPAGTLWWFSGLAGTGSAALLKKWSRQRRDRCDACGRSVSLRLSAGAPGLILEDKRLFCVHCRGFLHVAAQYYGRTVGVLVLAACTIGSDGWRMKDPLQIVVHSSFQDFSVRTVESVNWCGCKRYNGGDGCIVYYRSVFVCVGSMIRGITLMLLKAKVILYAGWIVCGGQIKMQQLYELAHSKSTSFSNRKKQSRPTLTT